MSPLFLTRLLLPLDSPRVQRILGDAYQLHLMVMRGFPEPPGRVLFRLEPLGKNAVTHATLLVQGDQMPDWNSANLFNEVELSQVKMFEWTGKSGERFRFRLRANPTVKKTVPGKKNGSRVPVQGEEGRLDWLRRKGEIGGFRVLGTLALDEGTVMGRKGPSKMVLQAARYEGLLEVTDAALLSEALANGLGSAKGMGFGLLSLAPALEVHS